MWTRAFFVILKLSITLLFHLILISIIEQVEKRKVSEEILRILIVDDVPQVRLGLTTMLRLASRNSKPKIEVVGEAKNGDDAIRQTKLLHPDVILMDLEMPVSNGYHATQSIKSTNPSTFIIILTIHDDPITRQKASQAGADAFIVKSAPLDSLIQVILDHR